MTLHVSVSVTVLPGGKVVMAKPPACNAAKERAAGAVMPPGQVAPPVVVLQVAAVQEGPLTTVSCITVPLAAEGPGVLATIR